MFSIHNHFEGELKMFKKLMKVCVLSVASVGVLFSFQESTFAATDLSSYYDGKNPSASHVVLPPYTFVVEIGRAHV